MKNLSSMYFLILLLTSQVSLAFVPYCENPHINAAEERALQESAASFLREIPVNNGMLCLQMHAKHGNTTEYALLSVKGTEASNLNSSNGERGIYLEALQSFVCDYSKQKICCYPEGYKNSNKLQVCHEIRLPRN